MDEDGLVGSKATDKVMFISQDVEDKGVAKENVGRPFNHEN